MRSDLLDVITTRMDTSLGLIELLFHEGAK